MQGAVLPPNVGVTHDVFSRDYERQDRFTVTTYEDGTEERKELSLFDRFKHIYVKEVVREPRMNFQRVPKLGAFMAIPLVYKSCLFDESLTESIANYQDVTTRQTQQDQDIENWEH